MKSPPMIADLLLSFFTFPSFSFMCLYTECSHLELLLYKCFIPSSNPGVSFRFVLCGLQYLYLMYYLCTFKVFFPRH